MRVILVILCGLNLILTNNALADTKAGSVGRYADGRAYRVDSQGYQLSDQIAELEATIKEQELQISSCENQLSGKPSGKNALPKAEQCPKVDCPVVKAPVSLSPTAELCAPFTAPLNSEVTDLKVKLSKAPRPEQIGALSEESIQLRQSLSASEDNAKSTLASERSKLALLESKNKELSFKITELSAEVEHKNNRVNELLASIEKLSDQKTAAKESAEQSSRAMLATKSEPEEAKVIKITKEESVDNKRAITARLAEIQNLVTKRKDIFDSVRSSKKGISIRMQPLVTENGVTLDQLRQRASAEASEFGALSHGLNEIKAILLSDIQVMERLIKHL